MKLVAILSEKFIKILSQTIDFFIDRMQRIRLCGAWV